MIWPVLSGLEDNHERGHPPPFRTNPSSSYDTVADEYVRRIYDELRHKPLDRQLLERFAMSVRGHGPVCDLGCGPGHVTRHLHDLGVEICGVDVSPGMILKARELNPDIEFHEGDMLALADADETWAGITAFYSIIHIPRDQVVDALREMRRVLQPGGWLLLTFHLGDETIHLDEWWGMQVDVDFFFFGSSEMASLLSDAGLEVGEIIERDPYAEVEHPSRRAYIFAKRPEMRI